MVDGRLNMPTEPIEEQKTDAWIRPKLVKTRRLAMWVGAWFPWGETPAR